jgi:putative Holliday junction resolvase
LNKPKRILALDVGKKRTGLSQSDPMLTIASPIGAFERTEIFNKIREINLNSQILKIVVGWPIHLSGQSGASVDMVKTFMKELNKHFPDIETDILDERFTTTMAQQAILASGAKKKKRQDKGLVDAIAATILLQNYLDRQSYSL